MELIALVLLALSIACYSIRELQSHGKLRWQKEDASFWGTDSWTRKYKMENSNTTFGFVMPPLNNWYYRIFKVKYVERFPLSATFLVSLTDAYHALQSLSFVCFAGAFSLNSGINFFIVWGVILGTHFAAYYLFQKK